MTTIAGRFVIEADDDPWLFMAVVCTISVLMIRAWRTMSVPVGSAGQSRYRSFGMWVADLHHFLDLPEDTRPDLRYRD